MLPKVTRKGTRRNIQGRSLAVRHTRLRTKHILTRSYLYRIGQVLSPNCPTCLVEETVEHLLIDCPKLNTQRTPIKQWLESHKLTLTLELLLGYPRKIDSTIRKSTLQHTLDYIRKLPIFPVL